MNKHITLTVIFQGKNLNYGESVGNIGTLKKHYRDGRVLTYMSRQALRYSLIELLSSWDKRWKTDVTVEGKTTQYDYKSEIDKNPELDLFGYMKTKTGKSKKDKENKDDDTNKKEETYLRTAPVRISDAVSLEEWSSETTFNNNMGLHGRSDKGGDKTGLLPYTYETHMSYYTYTVTIDLARIGKDDNSGQEVSNDEKALRINTMLEGLKLLYRDIRGRREELTPLFVIGGITKSGNPFFYNLMKIEHKSGADHLNTESIKSKLNMTVCGEKISDNIKAGLCAGIFANDLDIKGCGVAVTDIETFFADLESQVKSYYGVK